MTASPQLTILIPAYNEEAALPHTLADGSPWKATGATDPNAIGAAVVRTLALNLAGELKGLNVEFPPILVTATMLKEKNITNMDDLRKAEPALNISDVSSSDWMPVVTF